MGSCPSKPGEPGYTGPPPTAKPPPVPPKPTLPPEEKSYNLPQVPTTPPVIPTTKPPEPSPYPTEPNAKCNEIFSPWLAAVVDKSNISLDEVRYLLTSGMTEQEIEECVEYAKKFGETINLPPKPWDVSPEEIPEPVSEPPPIPQPEPVPEAQPEPVPQPPSVDIQPKIDEFLTYLDANVTGVEWAKLDSIKSKLGEIITLLGDPDRLDITTKDSTLAPGTQFVNVEIRKDNRVKWMSKPINVNPGIVQQKGGAIEKFEFVIYKNPITAGRIRIRTYRKGKKSKKSRKTLRRK